MKKKDEKNDIPYQIPTLELFTVPQGSIVADPFGNYTGRPLNEAGIPEEMQEIPVQDADDL